MMSLENERLFEFEIDEHVIKIDNMFEVKVTVYSKVNPQVVFKIKTKFLGRPFSFNIDYSKYFYLKKFPKGLHQFEVKKSDGLISIYNIETKMRICRIPIHFMNEVIDKCDKLVEACLIKPRTGIDINYEDTKIIQINYNREIYFGLRCDQNLRPGYLSFSNDQYLADWMTLLEYEDIPKYEISVRKKINSLETIEI